MNGDFIIIGGRRTGKSTQLLGHALKSLRNLGKNSGNIISPTKQMSQHLFWKASDNPGVCELDKVNYCLSVFYLGDKYRLSFLSLRQYEIRELDKTVPCYFDEMDVVLKHILPNFVGGAMTYPLVKLDSPLREEDEKQFKRDLPLDQFKREFKAEFVNKE